MQQLTLHADRRTARCRTCLLERAVASDNIVHDRQPDQPHLIRALGRRDLVLLFVVAVFNLNVVPSIAANGGVTVWLWIISLLLFFWPQGIAVIELAHRYPGEGGVYLWAKEVFGDFHGFLSGWCYWTNNMLYVPTVMLYFVGVSVYVLGPGHQGLRRQQDLRCIGISLALLALLTVLNILGLGVGKWINNLGAIGTFIAAAVLDRSRHCHLVALRQRALRLPTSRFPPTHVLF